MIVTQKMVEATNSTNTCIDKAKHADYTTNVLNRSEVRTMFTYYNRKTRDFCKQKTRTKSANKILITAEKLESGRTGTYGPAELPGQYVSVIDGVEFYWNDLTEMLVDPEWDIKVFLPDLESICVLIDR